MPDMWAKLLFTYGPYGVLVFFVFVTIKKAREFLTTAPKNRQGIAVAIYASNWIVILGLVAITMLVWVKNSIRDEAIIRGRLIGMAPTGDFRSPFEGLYMRRVYETRSQSDFEWRIISQQKKSAGTAVDFYLDQSTPDHDDIKIYELRIKDDFYGQEVTLTYDQKGRKLYLSQDSGPVPLEEMNVVFPNVRSASQPFRFELIPTVYAQTSKDHKLPLDSKVMSERLESNDSIVRLQARADLAAQGGDALFYIQEVLMNPASSYRSRLGVLAALNNMSADPLVFSPSANCAIAEAANSADATLKEQAKKFLSVHHLNLPPHCNLKSGMKQDTTGTSQAGYQKTSNALNSHSGIPLMNSSNPASAYKPDLLRVAQNSTMDPELSAALILYDLSGTNPSLSHQQTRALQNLVWTNSWVPTYSIAGAHTRINDLDISPDNRLLVVGLENRTVQILELASGKQLKILEGTNGPVRSVRFNHDGSIVVATSYDGTVRLWNVNTSSGRGLHLQNPRPLIGALFSADSSRLITLDRESRVTAWNISDGWSVRTIRSCSNYLHRSKSPWAP